MRYFIIKYDSYNSLSTSFYENQITIPLSRLPAINSETPITFIASVGGTKKYQGYAHLLSINPLSSTDQKPTASVHWVKRYPTSGPVSSGGDLSRRANGIPFHLSLLFVNSLDHNRSINQCRNFQEVDENCGKGLCQLIDEDVIIETKKDEDLKASNVVKPFYESETTNWSEFLEKVREKMELILFAGHVGSHCFNLNVPSSDTDMIVIAAAPSEVVLNLNPPLTTIKNPPLFQPDYTIHEVSHFIELMINGDTRMVEQLFQDDLQSIYQHDHWLDLQSVRWQFLTTKVASGKKGVVQVEGMWKDMEMKGKQNDPDSISKIMKKMCIHSSLLFWLLNNAKQIVMTGDLHLYMKDDSPERLFLLDIRAGKYEYKHLVDLAVKTKEELEDKLRENTFGLVDNVPLSTLNFISDWLLHLRLDAFNKVSNITLLKSETPIKILFVAIYDPHTNPPTYIAIFSVKTEILLSSPKMEIPPPLLEQVHQLAFNLLGDESKANLQLAKNSSGKKQEGDPFQLWEVGKFCELAAANSLKTAEVMCTPKEAIIFELPDWERMRQAWRSGSLSSFRLARKSVEVAKKLINGDNNANKSNKNNKNNKNNNNSNNNNSNNNYNSNVDSVSVKYQFWKLALIASSYLQKRFSDFHFPHDSFYDVMQLNDFPTYATTLVVQMEQLLATINVKDEGSKDFNELSDVLISLRTDFL